MDLQPGSWVLRVWHAVFSCGHLAQLIMLLETKRTSTKPSSCRADLRFFGKILENFSTQRALCGSAKKIYAESLDHTPSKAGTFRKKFRKDPGNALRAFPGIPLGSTAGIPQTLYKPYNSRHLRLLDHFQNSLPLTTPLGRLVFFRSGSGEGLAELLSWNSQQH